MFLLVFGHAYAILGMKPLESVAAIFIALVVLFYFRKGLIGLRRMASGGSTSTRIGRFHPDCLNYESRLMGSRVFQKWELDKKGLRNRWKTYSDKDKRGHYARIRETLKVFNLRGARETNGAAQYAGQVDFKLSSNSDSREPIFGHHEYLQYIEFWGKFSIVRVTDRFDKMRFDAWGRANLRADLSYDLRLDNGQMLSTQNWQEAKEFYELIKLKNRFTKEKRKKNTLAPFEDQFLHAYEYQLKIANGQQEALYEPHLDAIKKGQAGFGENNGLGISNKGVHIGGGKYVDKEGHFMTFGATRSGKGTSLVIPQLLNHESYPGSMIIIDVKGTLTAITARSMQEHGFETIILDPWNIQEKYNTKHSIQKDSINPLDILDIESDDLLDDCDMLAESLVPKNAETKDPYWEDRARSWVSTYLLYLAHRPDEERTLSNLRSLFKLSSEKRISLLVDMEEDYDVNVLKENAIDIRDSFEHSAKEAQGVLSHVHKELEIFKSPAMERATGSSTFDINSITNGKKRVFLIIPPERLETHAKWLRIMMSMSILATQRNKNQSVLLLMDEFPALGYMQIIDKNIGLTPEYRLQFWMILQDLNQLKKHYPKSWESFISNSVVTTWLGTSENTTAEYLSKLMGTTTVKYKSDRAISDELHGGNAQPIERLELTRQTPHAIRDYDGIYAIFGGSYPLKIAKKPYYEDDRLKALADDNPLLS
ncbi:hypothetical protein BFP97_17885 [Roseivirga sp. 4D4]|uniref:type IV secretory system conjugative DNA transfer family protein n=1 Tax=Roseivirga sp. 4D4 TaxID=1889784 RepID=UPI0008532D57|nr:type IV secretory system conjugative DNA transfer family protein [Roseivirga sp. 4D4]OEK03281.1 hypothetical protein BFP97_17885 [Roseivirga sp. 4D4]